MESALTWPQTIGLAIVLAPVGGLALLVFKAIDLI
jgi:hypothetical protein